MELNFKETKILLVDDDKNYGFALKTLLGAKGLNINSFINPEEALEYLKTNKVDVILLDYYMPEMTGEEFLKRFREFNLDTIVFLQTAFSEEKPQLEMLETLNIQGYIDKNKEPNEIFLEIASGIKMSELMKKIKEQKKQIDAQEYKNEFLGKFLNHLMGEIGERTMAMAGGIIHLEEIKETIQENNKELFIDSVDTIKRSSNKLNELIKSLSISEGMITIGELEYQLKSLFDITLAIKDIKLNFNYEEKYTMLDCKREILIYIIVDIIEYLVKVNEKEINFLVEKGEKITIKVDNEILDIELNEKLNKLAYLDDNIKVNKEAKKINIVIG